jgi:microcystin-dependent protein
MSNPFVAEIRIFPFNFAPKGWAFCDGQILPLSQNTALFSLLGTTYGGDGKSNFALPDLQGAVPLQQGQGPGLSLYDLGETTGGDTVTLVTSEMPGHSHNVQADFDHFNAKATSPNGAVLVNDSPKLTFANAPASPNLQPMNPSMISVAGGSLPHNNLMPYLTLNYCIALQGVYPPRT